MVQQSSGYPVAHAVCECRIGYGPRCCDAAGKCSYSPNTCPLQWGATSRCQTWDELSDLMPDASAPDVGTPDTGAPLDLDASAPEAPDANL